MGQRKLTEEQSNKITSYFGNNKKVKPTPPEPDATGAEPPKKVWTKEDLPKKIDRFSVHYPKGVAEELLKALNKKQL